MKLPEIVILDEKEKILHEKAKPVTEFPLAKEDQKKIEDMIKYLTMSQIEEYAEKYDLRPGMGLAFPQLGKNIRIIVIVHEVDDEVFDNYVMINPVIISHSEEMIAVEAGEGCLSVNRDVPGHVARYARVTVEGFDEKGNKKVYVDSETENFPNGLTEEKFFTKPILTKEDLVAAIKGTTENEETEVVQGA